MGPQLEDLKAEAGILKALHSYEVIDQQRPWPGIVQSLREALPGTSWHRGNGFKGQERLGEREAESLLSLRPRCGGHTPSLPPQFIHQGSRKGLLSFKEKRD